MYLCGDMQVSSVLHRFISSPSTRGRPDFSEVLALEVLLLETGSQRCESSCSLGSKPICKQLLLTITRS